MKAKKYFLFCLSALVGVNALGQEINTVQLPKPKRLIDKVEVFVGPSLSFNYGNKFVENYKDENVTNSRELKTGYTIGLGLYHATSKRIDLNLRFQYEQKGTKAELNKPLGNDRQTIVSEYTYNYTNISIAPRYLIGRKTNLAVSFGGYFAMINSMKGQEKYSDPSGGSVINNFIGRNWNVIDSDGAIRTWTFIPGLKSFNSYDYGLLLGFSYGIQLKEQHSLLIQLIDQYGLQPVYNSKYPENLLEKNHTISLVLSYLFYRKPLNQ